MNLNLSTLSVVIFCLVLSSVRSEPETFDAEDAWEVLRDFENEIDYDNYGRDDFDATGPEKSELRAAPGYADRMRQHPKFNRHFRRQNRDAFPNRDFEGNCPPGYRTDRAGICREIW